MVLRGDEMYQAVLSIQVFSIIVLFSECWVVFKNWKGTLHAWLFLGCVSTLVNNIGYLMELLARTEEAYFTALKLSYLGRIWISFALFFFIVTLVHAHIIPLIKITFALINVATYIVVVTNEITGLYYRSMRFFMNGQFPVLDHVNGIWHHLWNVVLLLQIASGLYLLCSARHKEKNPIANKRLLMVILAVLTQSAFLIVEIFNLVPVTRVYDVTMLSFPIAAGFMFIAIFKYRLLDTETVAREYVIDELSEGIIAVDEHGRVSYYNKPAVTLFPALTKNAGEVVELFKKAIEIHEPIRLGDRIYSPEENELNFDGMSAGMLYALRDDTEHYRYMSELEEAKQAADMANKAKSSFLANMSHEIRTPINAVLGMDEMILRESREKDTISYASDIMAAGRTLLSLINDILDFSKIEEGRMEILPTQYELSSVINDLVNMIRDRAEKKGLKLLIDVDTQVPHLLYGDEIRIRQIVLNLLTNAVKYTKAGEVCLSVSFQKGVDKTDSEILLRFRVADTGIGMKEEDMEKLFSPFSRIEEERNRNIEGTGLGMSIVRELLALMDSHLDVKSVYGEGSEFAFEIKQKVMDWEPMGDVSVRFRERSEENGIYQELFHAPDAWVLVVDDTEVNLQVIRNLLKKTQVQIDTALSGEEALQKHKHRKYDVVFIDHMMPDMDGIEVLQRMKEQNKFAENGDAGDQTASQAVYIALTANAISGAREMYLKAGFEDYLSKPVDGRHLEEMLKKYLPKEKILTLSESPGEEPVGAEEVLPEWLRAIAALNIGEGMEKCGSRESYLSVLTTFHRTASQKADEIEKLYEDGDLKNYTIKVHALKSSARIIGAGKLSEMAKELEMTGIEGDETLIRKKTENLLREYREFDQKLTPLDDAGDNLKELSPDMQKEAFRTIGEIAECMDFGMMEDLIRDLKAYRLSFREKNALDEIEKRLMELDWNGIGKIVEEVAG